MRYSTFLNLLLYTWLASGCAAYRGSIPGRGKMFTLTIASNLSQGIKRPKSKPDRSPSSSIWDAWSFITIIPMPRTAAWCLGHDSVYTASFVKDGAKWECDVSIDTGGSCVALSNFYINRVMDLKIILKCILQTLWSCELNCIRTGSSSGLLCLRCWPPVRVTREFRSIIFVYR